MQDRETGAGVRTGVAEARWLYGQVKPATLNRSVFKLRYRHGSDCRTSDVTVGTEHMQWAESCVHDETG